MARINIAIDGYSSCGKSTLAKALAGELGYQYIDTGAMYRAVTLFFLRKGIIQDKDPRVLGVKNITALLSEVDIRIPYDPVKKCREILLNGENVDGEIRGMEVSAHVSDVSKIPEVRKKMVSMQRVTAKEKGVVMEGRDIGTVVLPDAELKIFLTADPELRARRRYRELKATGMQVSLNEVRQNLRSRDMLDTSRKDSPLRKPKGAITLDNTILNKQEVLEKALFLAKKMIGSA